MNMASKFPVACVHGRFQPPHLDHLRYMLAAKERADFLWIGLAQYDLWDMEECLLAPHRGQPDNNPLTYYERVTIIADVLVEAGCSRAEFGCIPFPIDRPDRIRQFLSPSVVCLTTICEDWNSVKIETLRAAGYVVEVLWNEPKRIEGRRIREAIVAGDESWRELVPAATSKALDRLDIRSRLVRPEAAESATALDHPSGDGTANR